MSAHKAHKSDFNVVRQARKIIRQLEPIGTFSLLSSLQVMPIMAANAYRLEVLLSDAIIHARGNKRIDEKTLAKLFELYGQAGASLMEDPSEDLFVSRVEFNDHDYRVFEGLWEGSCSKLQRVINAYRNLDLSRQIQEVTNSIYALLMVSDRIADAAALSRYSSGEEYPQSTIAHVVYKTAKSVSNAFRYTNDQLIAMGIDPQNIIRYSMTIDEWRSQCSDNEIRLLSPTKPFLRLGQGFIVISPANISTALRHYIVNALCDEGHHNQLWTSFLEQIHDDIRSLPWMHRISKGSQDATSINPSGILTDLYEIDPGAYLHLLVISEDFSNRNDHVFSSVLEPSAEIDSLVESTIAEAYSTARGAPSFRSGMTLVILAGWSSGISLGFSSPSDDWAIRHISLHDLTTMSWNPGFRIYHLFQIVKQQIDSLHLGYESLMPTSLMDCYALGLQDSGYLFPGNITRDPGASIRVMLPTNASYELRCSVANEQDVHIRMNPQGRPVKLGRYQSGSYFESDRFAPLYGVYDSYPCSVYIGKWLSVWLSCSSVSPIAFSEGYVIFDAFTKWLPPIVNAIEELYPETDPLDLSWHVRYESLSNTPGNMGDIESSQDRLCGMIDIRTSKQPSRILSIVPRAVLAATLLRENVAERVILCSLIDGISNLLSNDIDADEVLDMAIRSPDQRQLHMGLSAKHSDYVADQLEGWPIYCSDFNSANARLGVAMIAGLDPNTTVDGVEECNRVMTKLVQGLWNRIKQQLEHLNRDHLVTCLLTNVLAARHEIWRWDISRNALRSMYASEPNDRNTAAREVFRNNYASMTSRMLVEMAIYHCPVIGGARSGAIDLCELMADLELMVYYGGVSNAIRHGFVPPKLTVLGNGVVTWQGDDYVAMYESYGLSLEDNREVQEIQRPTQAVHQNSIPSDYDQFDAAFTAEYGISIEEYVTFIEHLVGKAIDNRDVVSHVSWAELVREATDSGAEHHAEKLCENIVLSPRADWATPPDGYQSKDIMPWEFGRRLSLMYRPILMIDDSESKKCVYCAGILRECLAARLELMRMGQYPDHYFDSDEMKAWVGGARHRLGNEFTQHVARMLKDAGWEVQTELTLSRVFLAAGLEEYGDIDVLAYHKAKREVLIVGCKRLHLARNPSEIVRQLSEFQGDVGDEIDRLGRHIRRVTYSKESRSALEKYLSTENTTVRGIIVFNHAVPMIYRSQHPEVEVVVEHELQSI